MLTSAGVEHQASIVAGATLGVSASEEFGAVLFEYKRHGVATTVNDDAATGNYCARVMPPEIDTRRVPDIWYSLDISH